MTGYHQRPWDIVYSEEGMMLNGAHLLVHALGSVSSLLIIGLIYVQLIQLCHVPPERHIHTSIFNLNPSGSLPYTILLTNK